MQDYQKFVDSIWWDNSGVSQKNNSKKERIPVSQGTIKELFIRCEGKCERCNDSLKRYRPHIHHKNKNPSDNKKTNLIVLCPNCHSKAHFKDNTKTVKRKGSKRSMMGGKIKGTGLPNFDNPLNRKWEDL